MYMASTFQKTKVHGFWLNSSFLIALLALLSLNVSAQVATENLEFYQKLNNGETRLSEFKDSDRILALKVKQLALINASRKKYKAPPVELDILASRVANKMCKEMAVEGYFSHWNMAGQKPYHRYAEAGGMDHISENTSRIDDPRGFEDSDEVYLNNMKMCHDAFMAERKPNDAHKQTIIQKSHTHVGIGIWMENGRFRYNEEFIERYYEFGEFPTQGKVGETITLKVKAQEGKYLYQIIGFREQIKAAKPKMMSYSDYSKDMDVKVFPWELSSFRNADGWYEIPIKFEKAGFYYVQIYQDDKDHPEPGGVDTEGKLQASGVVIEIK